MFRIFKKKKEEVTEDECFDKVCTALKEVMPEELKNKVLRKGTQIEELGIDSIKYINLFMSLEEIIGKELEDIVESIEISSLKRVDDIVDLVKKLKTN